MEKTLERTCDLLGSLADFTGQYFDPAGLAQYNPNPTRERTQKELQRFIERCAWQGLVRKWKK
jgi:NifB/MoaA-like Fe-S oxidoreductase